MLIATFSSLMLMDARLTLSTGIGWYILSAIGVIAFAWLIYRFTLPPVSRLRKSALWILRGLALMLLVFLLFEPVISYFFQKRQPPAVALLVDHSASMAVVRNGNARSDGVAAFLHSPALRSLEHRADIHSFTFADSLIVVPLDSLSELSYTGVGTDLAGAWTRAERKLSTVNLAAIVMLSDGAYNAGENPMRIAAASTVPIYCLGVGDTTVMADALISDLLTNEVTYKGSQVPLAIRVRGVGLNGKASTLRVFGRNGVEVGSRSVRFDGDNVEISVDLSFEATEAGDLRISARLDSIPGESIFENNRRSIIVRVLDRKSSVYLFAGPPSADVTILRQTLDKDTTLEVTAFVENRGGGMLYDRTIPNPEDLGKANLIVLVDFPTRSTPAALVERLARIIEEGRIPILFLAGPDIQSSSLGLLKDVLPFRILKPAPLEQRVIARAGAAHPALATANPLPLEWPALPPVFGGIGNFSADAVAQVAVKLSREELGISEDEPGLLFWEVSSRRGAALLAWGTSKWQMQLAESSAGSDFYTDLIQRIRAWLVAPIEEQPVRIRTTKKLYSGGETIRFLGEVYGADLAPRDDASIEVRISSDSRTETVALHIRGNGRYEGELIPWTEGEYRFVGRAVAHDDTLGSDRGMFAVEAFNIELLETHARFDILRQISTVSGGAFAPIGDADSLLQLLDLAPREITQRREATLWNRGIMIWAIIILLSAEWMIRKRSGML